MADARVSRKWLWIGGAIVVVGLGMLGGLVYYLLLPSTPTARIRDVFLVLLALEGLLVGLGILVLTVELGLLLYTLYVEVLPILESLQQTARNVQGTSTFLSQRVTRPVIRAYGWLAALRAFKDLFHPGGAGGRGRS